MLATRSFLPASIRRRVSRDPCLMPCLYTIGNITVVDDHHLYTTIINTETNGCVILSRILRPCRVYQKDKSKILEYNVRNIVIHYRRSNAGVDFDETGLYTNVVISN